MACCICWLSANASWYFYRWCKSLGHRGISVGLICVLVVHSSHGQDTKISRYASWFMSSTPLTCMTRRSDQQFPMGYSPIVVNKKNRQQAAAVVLVSDTVPSLSTNRLQPPRILSKLHIRKHTVVLKGFVLSH